MSPIAAVFLAALAVAYSQVVPYEFVVEFTTAATTADIATHMASVVASGSKVLFNYNIGAFRGYSVRIPHGTQVSEPLVSFLYAAEVSYFEANQIYKTNAPAKKPVNSSRVGADCNLQEEATWGLVRTAEAELNIDGLYPWSTDADGAGVFAYVIDTGIYLENDEFNRQAIWGYDAVDEPSAETDTNGHGTHVAGTIMSKNYGLAKAATSVAVRVLGSDGSGTTAGVIAGINFVATDGRGKKALANMSLGGGYSAALNNAVKNAVAAGITFIVAAGNEAQDACNVSPASEPSAITVACSNSNDAFCSFSNYGSCTDIIAPGQSITSTWIGSPYAINTISGTSMSSPHVAGVVAKILSASSTTLTPEQVRTALAQLAGQGFISGVKQPATTPNALVHYPCA